MGCRGHWPRQGGGEGPILERSAGERFVAWPKIRGKRHEYSAGTSICLECEICVSKESGFTYMGSIDFANITLQACDKPTRISLSSSCSAFSLLISASSVCTSFTSTCNLFPRRQAPPSTRCALELSCEPPSEENLHAYCLQLLL